MGYAKLFSRAQLGIDAPKVTVEVHLSGGLPSFSLVGLPETAVRESKERVRSALLNSGFDYPQSRITVNLAPADLPKMGGRYDLAIGLGILLASGQISIPELNRFEFVAELGLDGSLKAISGLFPAARACADSTRVLVTSADAAEQAQRAGSATLSESTLFQTVERLSQTESVYDLPSERTEPINTSRVPNLKTVVGQYQARRALEIAAAGGHNLLMSGSPGSGKTLLASCLPGILPRLTESDCVESASVYSVAGLPIDALFAGIRPFRMPHHNASSAAMVGGGSVPRPGEISLAHQGVLFLDEFPEFSRSVLEALREPLESGEIHISRASGTLKFPAEFMLVAARNPCPCGYANDGTERCECAPGQIKRYQNRVSGPLMDRFDLRITLNAIKPDELLLHSAESESSESVLKRVERARALQLDRQGHLNARLSSEFLKRSLNQAPALGETLTLLAAKMQLSARGCHRILKVARTLADMAERSSIETADLLEAASYRSG